jgi:hypothetical protein
MPGLARLDLLMLGAVLSIGCSPTEPVVFDVVGTWSGTTAQKQCCSNGNLPISLTVEPTGLEFVMISVDIKGSACDVSGQFGFGSGSLAPLAVVQNNRFAATRELSSTQMSFTITGEFTSPTQASRTLVVTNHTCGATAQTTWTATKEP